MLRNTFLWLSEQPRVFRFLKRNRAGRSVASRFVAGETVSTAIEAARVLTERNITASLDLLGESVTTAAETHTARDEVLETLEGMAEANLEPNVSVKLTQLGLDIDQSLCLENMRVILTRARDLDAFVRIDMESSEYTERTLSMFFEDLAPAFGKHTGVVIQSYLKRSADDVANLIAARARVRLCKGAYAEPESVAFQDRDAVDGSYVDLMESLLEHGNYPALATHDPKLIDHAITFVEREGIDPSRFEFQMLYGVRRDLQDQLRSRGFNMRVYIPFGTAWYPYLMRRLAERPANVGFMVGSVVRELLGSRS